jgi:hypothetical protein
VAAGRRWSTVTASSASEQTVDCPNGCGPHAVA